MNNNKLEITIKNYKSLIDIKISLNKKSPRLISIVGENNVGKTSLLEIIYKLSMNPEFDSKNRTNFLYHNKSAVKENPSIELKFFFENEYFGKEVKACIINNLYSEIVFPDEEILKTEKTISEIKNEIVSNSNYKESKAYIASRTFVEEYQWIPFLNLIRSTQDEDLIQLTENLRKLEKQLYSMKQKRLKIKFIKNRNLFEFTELNLNLIYPQDLDSTDLKKRAVLVLWEGILGENFKEFLETASLNNEDNFERDKLRYISSFEERANKIINEIAIMMGNINKYKFGISIRAGKLFISFKCDDSLFEDDDIVWDDDPAKSGAGIKAFYSIIFRLHEVKENEFSITLLDEPEKHLNIIYQNVLLKYMKKFSEEKDRINQIIIYATHSPFMIDMDLYQNLFILERSKKNNATELKTIYDTKDKKVPNALLDKNLELMFIEANLLKVKPRQIIFVEGISDFNVFSNIIKNDQNVFIIPLFGNEFSKTASFHIPYIQSFTDNYKLIVDNDDFGNGVIKWFNEKTNIKPENIKKISDFFPNKINLEDSIINKWFDKNTNYGQTNDKKIDSLIFLKNNEQSYPDITDFIYK